MAEPIRVLQVMAQLDRGGAETVIMDWLRRIDRDQVVFDFVVNDDIAEYAYEREALDLGCRIIRAPRFKLWNLLPYVVWWYRCLRRHEEWQIVHAHHTVPAFAYLSIARLMGRVTIAHSHSTGEHGTSGYGRVDRWVKEVLRRPLRRVSQYHMTCSELAAEWMFGHEVNVRLVPNGIQSERFGYSPKQRIAVRCELGLSDEFVVGHIGRLVEEKNHSKLLGVFGQVLARDPSTRLVLVGDGHLRGRIELEIAKLGLARQVHLVGVRQDIPDLLAAMDVFLLPSHREGLPVTLVEAQASGLPCVVSDAVTEEVALTDLVRFVSLAEPDEVWADAILAARTDDTRHSRIDELRAAGYDSAQVAQEMQELYLQLAGSDRESSQATIALNDSATSRGEDDEERA